MLPPLTRSQSLLLLLLLLLQVRPSWTFNSVIPACSRAVNPLAIHSTTNPSNSTSIPQPQTTMPPKGSRVIRDDNDSRSDGSSSKQAAYHSAASRGKRQNAAAPAPTSSNLKDAISATDVTSAAQAQAQATATSSNGVRHLLSSSFRYATNSSCAVHLAPRRSVTAPKLPRRAPHRYAVFVYVVAQPVSPHQPEWDRPAIADDGAEKG